VTSGINDLASSSVIYLETNVFIYAVEGTDETAKLAKTLLKYIRHARPPNVITSEITLAEVLAPIKRAGALPLQERKRLYLDLLVWSGIVTLVQINRSILLETANLRAVTNLKLDDANHLVSAIRGGCRFFVSGDTDFARMPAGMGRVVPDEHGIATLLDVMA